MREGLRRVRGQQVSLAAIARFPQAFTEDQRPGDTGVQCKIPPTVSGCWRERGKQDPAAGNRRNLPLRNRWQQYPGSPQRKMAFYIIDFEGELSQKFEPDHAPNTIAQPMDRIQRID